MRNGKTTVPITNKETNKSRATSSTATSNSAVTKEQTRMSLEKELEDINKRLLNYSKAKKKSELKPENELKLLEKKLILLLKLKNWKEVSEEGYKILGKKGPIVNIYKCILVSLCRLGKFEDDVVELLDHWKNATPKCTHMMETKRKMEGYLTAIRSGMNASVLLQNVEDVLGLNAELILSDNSEVESSWKFRQPPQRHNTFSLCPRISSGSACIYGDDCLLAHSKEELKEWQNRVQNKICAENIKKVAAKVGFDTASVSSSSSGHSVKSSSSPKEQIPPMYRLLPPACMYYLISLNKKVKETVDINDLFVDTVADVKIKYTNPLDAEKMYDGSPISHKWTFMVASRHPLATVTLFHDVHRERFGITGAFFFNSKRLSLDLIDLHPNNKVQKGIQVLNTFIRPDLFLPFNGGWPEWCCYQIDVAFQTPDNTPQVYEQSLVFDFKTDPKVFKRLSVTIEAPSSKADNCNPVNPSPVNEMTLDNPSNSNGYNDLYPGNLSDSDSDEDNSEKEVPKSFEGVINNIGPLNINREEPKTSVTGIKSPEITSASHYTRSEELGSDANILLRQWINQRRIDHDSENNLDFMNQSLKQGNYVLWMNRFLTLETKARQNVLLKLSGTIDIKFFNSSLNTPGNVASVGLFGELQLSRDISKDSKTGRLVLSSCQILTISKMNTSTIGSSRTFKCSIVNKNISSLVILIGHEAVEELHLRDGLTEKFDVSLCLDRTYLDSISNTLQGLREHHFQLLFPEFTDRRSTFKFDFDQKKYLCEPEMILNTKQREAFCAMVSSPSPVGNDVENSSPIVITGTHGCGKSYLIAQSVMAITACQAISKQPKRILICTYSDEAANKFIIDYFHPWSVKKTFPENASVPLRVYGAHPIQDISSVVKKYCLLTNDCTAFRCPTVDEILAHQIIIVALHTSFKLIPVGLPEDTFSHIFIDQAESMLEVESLCPISLAGKGTTVILSGDPECLNPEVFVSKISTKMMQFSLLERLDDVYPISHPYRIRLEETYSNNKDVIQFISKEFYSSSLQCTQSHPSHPNCFSVSFSCVFGASELQPDHGEGYYNMGEIYEIRDRIFDLMKAWPSYWGSPKEHSIAVFTSYADQAYALRVRLKLEGLSFVDVETLPNVVNIGNDYRVVFISLVRTFRVQNAVNLTDMKELDTDFGFFTNRRAVYTAITRAKSLVIVVGDLESVWNNNGPCRQIWQAYLSTCKENGTIIGYQNTAFLSSAVIKPKAICSDSELPINPIPRNIPSTLNITHAESRTITKSPSVLTAISNFSAFSSVLQNNTECSTGTGNCIEVQTKLKPISMNSNVNRPTSFIPDLVSASTPLDGLSNLSSIWNSPVSPITPSGSSNSNNISVSSRASIWDSYPVAASSNLGNLVDPKSIWGGVENSKITKTQAQITRISTPPGLCSTSIDTGFSSYKNPFDMPDVRILAENALGRTFPCVVSSTITAPTGSNCTAYRSDMQRQVSSNSSYSFSTSGTPSYIYSEAANKPLASGGNGISVNPSWPNMASSIRSVASPSPLTHSGNLHATHNSISDAVNPYGAYYGPRRPAYVPPPRMLKTYRPVVPQAASCDNFNSMFTKIPSKDFDFFRELDLEQKERKDSSSSSASTGSSRGSNELGIHNGDINFCLQSTDFPNLSDRNDNWIEVKSSKRSKSPAVNKQQQQQKKKGKKKSKASGSGAANTEVKAEPNVEQKIESLKEMGFEKKLAIKALQACDKDLHRAVEWLIQYAPTKKEQT